jgi:hypothetical protein
LAKLFCLLAHPEVTECTRTLLFVSVDKCLPILTKLLAGNESEVTSLVRRTVYDTLTCAVKHSALGEDSVGFDHVVNFALLGVEDGDRAVRLSAG